MKFGTSNYFFEPPSPPVRHFALNQEKQIAARKRQSKKEVNLSDCVKPIHLSSRLFGQLPFSLHFNANGHVLKESVGIFDVLWFVVSITIDFLLTFYVLCSLREPPALQSGVLLLGSRIVSLIAFVTPPISTIFDMINRKRVVKILQDFDAFDKNVRIIYFISISIKC